MKCLIRNFMFLVLVLFLAACNGESESTSNEGTKEEASGGDKSLTMLFSFASDSLDPHQDAIGVRAGITETLLKIDENLEIQPWLAEDWKQVDETTWEFDIRDGVTFHDGSKVDGKAVKASFERVIKENDAMDAALKIDSIEADGQKVTFTTREPHPIFISELIHTHASVIKADEDQIAEKPIGTGPFTVADFTPGSEINLERYDDYWDGAAKLDEVTIRFNSDASVRALSLQSGEADIAYHLPPEGLDSIESNSELKVESVPSIRTHFFLYNQQNEKLKDQKVRKALDMLINRKVMVEEIMNNHATEAAGPFNPDFPFAGEEESVEYDPKQAEALLKEAGYERNEQGMMEKDGEPLSLKIATYVARPELPLMAQYFQAEAGKIGVDVEIMKIENIDSYLHEKQEAWDLVTYSNLTAPRGDGGYFLNVAYLPDGSLNPGQINISRINELTEQLNGTADPEQRTALQKEAVAIINEEVPHSFVMHPHIIVGVHDRVKNWTPGSEENYLITNEMDVE
ncbi:nickel ABC transporter substrate-binding protein (plasmid) [Pseudalkalibacillus hwajinpoensis]|uniref:nickel ABC transporter substrate-binding protein n=1 Tax=Guptibacillus hwajinpoensis TaxID=208199 RepID=UPI00325BB0D2